MPDFIIDDIQIYSDDSDYSDDENSKFIFKNNFLSLGFCQCPPKI